MSITGGKILSSRDGQVLAEADCRQGPSTGLLERSVDSLTSMVGCISRFRRVHDEGEETRPSSVGAKLLGAN